MPNIVKINAIFRKNIAFYVLKIFYHTIFLEYFQLDKAKI